MPKLTIDLSAVQLKAVEEHIRQHHLRATPAEMIVALACADMAGTIGWDADELTPFASLDLIKYVEEKKAPDIWYADDPSRPLRK